MKGKISAKMDRRLVCKQNDDLNRLRFRRLLQEAQTFLQDQRLLPFRSDLEACCPQYENRLENYMQQLQSNQCVLLVAGEIGSGKSSLINLLLGADILPTGEQGCTSTFVEIVYGKMPGITAYYRANGATESAEPYQGEVSSSVESLTVIVEDLYTLDSAGHGFDYVVTQARLSSGESLDSFLDKVKLVTTSRDMKTDESVFETVKLEWPVETLQGGVTIVDCPGVGVNERVSSQLSEYLERALGVLYVIDSSSTKRKQWLGQLLMKSIELHDGFDDKTTIFACNHLDKVTEADAVQLLESTRSMLGMILPEDADIKLYQISVKESARAVTYGQLNLLHQNLLTRLRKVVSSSWKGKLQTQYRYLSNLLKRALFTIRFNYNTNKEKGHEISSLYSQVETRLNRKQMNPQERLSQLRRQVQDKIIDASNEVLNYLNATATRTMLTRWEDKDCPKKRKLFQQEKFIKQTNAKISERVAERIDIWEKDNNFIDSLEMDVIQFFKDEFQLIDEELRELQGSSRGGNKQMQLPSEAVSKDNGKINQQQPVVNREDDIISIGATVASCFGGTMEQRIKKLFNSQSGNNPPKAIEDATELYLDTMMSDTKAVASAMSTFCDRLLNNIVHVGGKVHDLMGADRNLLAQLKEELQTRAKRCQHLPDLEKMCRRCMGHLDMFYVQELIVCDFREDQISYAELLGSGSSADVYKGHLQLEGSDHIVAVKVPKEDLTHKEATHALVEASMLRSLQHSNIVKYYGLFKERRNNSKIILVTEYCPSTLKKRLNEMNSPSSRVNSELQQREAIRRMAKHARQISSALVYLHHKFVVHGDLKPENILLSDQDDARIADLGLATKVKDLGSYQIGTPVYMAPEILLLKGKSDTKVDIYSFALVMWEMWYGKDLSRFASRQIQCKLETAIEDEWRPSLYIVHEPHAFWLELIQQCWHQEPGQRPTAPEIASRLSQYCLELEV